MRLHGKTALITGASRGIGRSIAEVFAREGASLLLTARTPDVMETAAMIASAGGNAEALQGEITDDQHVRALIQRCRVKFGGLNVLVNNAGIMIPGNIGMTRLDDVRRMFDVNFIAPLSLTQYALRAFPRGAGGSIVNLSSIAATRGIEGLAAYCASKAALLGFTKAAAKELAAQKVRVNALAPGFIETDMTRQFAPEVIERTVSRIRMGRMGLPEEVAKVAVFLASDESSYVTGQVFSVDGGMEA